MKNRDVYEVFLSVFPNTPKASGFETMEDLPNVTGGLLERGWPEATSVRFLARTFSVYTARHGKGADEAGMSMNGCWLPCTSDLPLIILCTT